MEDMMITPKEKEKLRLGAKLKLPGLYCSQCDQCRSQCRYGLDVPRIMRSYMYAYGYKDPAKAADALQYVDLNNPDCNKCLSCSIRCPMNFDIKNKILDIARIKQVPSEFLV